MTKISETFLAKHIFIDRAFPLAHIIQAFKIINSEYGSNKVVSHVCMRVYVSHCVWSKDQLSSSLQAFEILLK